MSAESHPGHQSPHNGLAAGLRTPAPVQRHRLAVTKGNPSTLVHCRTPPQRRRACGASRAPSVQFSSHPSFSKGPFSSHTPPPTPPPHFHTLLAFKENISPSPFGLVLPPAFRRPLYQARSRQAGQTLPQGHCEPGLGA